MKERKKEALSVAVVRLPKLRQNENVGAVILTDSFLLIYTLHAVIVAYLGHSVCHIRGK